MSLRTVLLDAGGVLLDEEEMEQSRAEASAEYLGYRVEQYWKDIEEAVHAHCADTYRCVFDKYEADYEGFEREWRLTAPPLRLTEGVDAEVRRLARSFDLAIAGQYGAAVVDLLHEHDLAESFRWLFTQDDFPLTKPDPRYFEQIAWRCGADPTECLMVGDRIDKDVAPAKSLGMRTVRIRVGLHKDQEPRSPEETPDAELRGVTGLAACVEGLALR